MLSFIGTFIEPGFEDKYSIDIGSARKYPPQIYDVIFKEPKKRGDYVHYRVLTELFDEREVMLSFLSQHISGPTKKMELVVSVPKGMIKKLTVKKEQRHNSNYRSQRKNDIYYCFYYI